MTRWISALLLLAAAGSAAAFQPRTGPWWNPNESGSGYNIDVQDGVIVIAIYAYQAGGSAQWYLASGAMTNGQKNFTGTLDKYTGGQCISCAYAGRPTLVGNDGAVSIAFSSETSATLTLPGGRVTQIQPFNFAIGDPPNGLAGEWVFIYDVSSTTIANRFDLTTMLSPSSSGNGVVADLTRLAGCELQTSGPAAGVVICAIVNAAGTVQYGYGFFFGLDQTYSGLWISADGNTTLPMKGFKVISKSGFANTAGSKKSAVVAHAAASVLDPAIALGDISGGAFKESLNAIAQQLTSVTR